MMMTTRRKALAYGCGRMHEIQTTADHTAFFIEHKHVERRGISHYKRCGRTRELAHCDAGGKDPALAADRRDPGSRNDRVGRTGDYAVSDYRLVALFRDGVCQTGKRKFRE